MLAFCYGQSSTTFEFKSEQIQVLFLSLEIPQRMRTGGCLIRFWTPVSTRSKRKRLSISEQPFGVGKVCNGVCRYRFHCILYANGLKNISEASPICRSFTWDHPEFSPNKDSYSEEFPLKNYAKDCGLQGYFDLPTLFEQRNDMQRQERGSTGVLEILTFTENISLDATSLEKSKVGLAIQCPLPCRKPEGCGGRSDMRFVGLYPLRDPHNLPLIQDVYNAVYYNVHRSACQTGCQELGIGKEDPKVATVKQDDIKHHQIQNSQLGEVSKAAKRLVDDQVQSHELGNGKDGPKLGTEDDKVQSHELGNIKEDHEVATVQEDNIQQYWVKKRQFSVASKATKRLKSDQVQRHEASGSHEEKQWLSLSVQHPNLETAADKKSTQCFPLSVQQLSSETTADKKNPQGKTESSGEPGSNIRKRKIITLAMLEKYFGSRLKDAAEELKVHKSTLKRCCRSYGIQRWPSHEGNKANPVPCDSRLSPDHNSREKQVTDANRPVEQPSLETTCDEKNTQVTTEDSGEPGPKIHKREITLDMIQNSFGRRLTDVAKELKVHKSTLKRWCRSYGIERWPSPKINKPDPVLKPSNELRDCGGKDQECNSRPSPDHNSREKHVM